jgi:DNA-binding MarR family transcriptional regulator
VVRLALTPEGEAIAARMPAIFTGVLDSLLGGFSAEEVGFLKSMLRRVLVNAGEQTGLTRDAASNLDGKS